jgi:hypothetical protein
MKAAIIDMMQWMVILSILYGAEQEMAIAQEILALPLSLETRLLKKLFSYGLLG